MEINASKAGEVTLTLTLNEALAVRRLARDASDVYTRSGRTLLATEASEIEHEINGALSYREEA